MNLGQAQVSPPSGRRLRGAVLAALADPSDRFLLSGFFLLLFGLDYLMRFFGKEEFPAVEIFALLAVAAVLRGMGRDKILTRWDHLALALAALVVVHPWRHVGDLALTGLGALFCARRDPRLAALGQLCLGLAFAGVWSQIAQAAIEEAMLPAETFLAYRLLTLFDSFTLIGNAISRVGGDHATIVEGACSSFPNVALTFLLWLSFLKLQALPFTARNLCVLLAAAAVLVAVNTVRLALCAWSMDTYNYWHESDGVAILAWIMLLSQLAIYHFGLRGAPQWKIP